MRADLSIFADYYQFYLQDEPAEGNLGDSWDGEAVARLLAVASGTVGVGTAKNVDVQVAVEVLDSEPASDFTGSDLVTEATLDVTSGKIVIAGCTDYFPDARRIEVPLNRYRVRIYYSGLSTVSADGLEGEDHYRVVLWRDELVVGPRVLHDVRGATAMSRAD
jgi:hypothetical protein